METGIELIAKERKEQIEKHGYEKDRDDNYTEGELKYAAAHFLTGDENEYPPNWDSKFAKKVWEKNEVDRLKIAGALIAAEIDRLNRSLAKKEA